MPKFPPPDQLEAIEDVVRTLGGSVAARSIATALAAPVPRRTLQYRLKHLVDAGRLIREGEGRWARYRLPEPGSVGTAAEQAAREGPVITLSDGGAEVERYLRQPVAGRTPTGYRREFLDDYRPNVSFHLSAAQRAHLAAIGRPPMAAQPAGAYARQILGRLLIDLSWNSSRLEGNTYSLLDTRRLIEFGEAAEGQDRLAAQMILNHEDAIEFLVGAAEDIGFNRYTILNLHAILANNLLSDERAAGRLRQMAVGIEGSVLHPPEGPQPIEECFDHLLATATAIDDPFEQAFFVMVHVPYLQPFDDVNKRVSRLAANIPFIAANLVPLSFTDVPRSTYTQAILGVYELNRIDLLRDVFIWAYERSAARYAAVRQSLGEPDPFRLQHRTALRELIGDVVRQEMDRRRAAAHIAGWVSEYVATADRATFRELAETELLSLHEGNFARYQVRPSEFAAWRDRWNSKP